MIFISLGDLGGGGGIIPLFIGSILPRLDLTLERRLDLDPLPPLTKLDRLLLPPTRLMRFSTLILDLLLPKCRGDAVGEE